MLGDLLFVMLVVFCVVALPAYAITRKLFRGQAARASEFEAWLSTLDPEERRHQEMMRAVRQAADNAAYMLMLDRAREDWYRQHRD